MEGPYWVLVVNMWFMNLKSAVIKSGRSHSFGLKRAYLVNGAMTPTYNVNAIGLLIRQECINSKSPPYPLGGWGD